MFRLPNTLPSIDLAEISDLLDWVEWQCLVEGSVSFLEALRPMMAEDDEIDTDEGIDESDARLDAVQDAICIGIEKRREDCDDNYPFIITRHGLALEVDRNNASYYPYAYLLLSTRLNMGANKRWAGIDGTTLLERLSGLVAEEYFGQGAKHQIFGTGGGAAGMNASVELLIANILEGGNYQNEGAEQPQDGGIDIIAWKPFADKNACKLITFGQCKTGQSWGHADLSNLTPSEWCKTWLTGVISPDPVKSFFCSRLFPFDKKSWVNSAGIVFDRVRIMNYCKKAIPEEIAVNLKDWVDAVLLARAIPPN